MACVPQGKPCTFAKCHFDPFPLPDFYFSSAFCSLPCDPCLVFCSAFCSVACLSLFSALSTCNMPHRGLWHVLQGLTAPSVSLQGALYFHETMTPPASAVIYCQVLLLYSITHHRLPMSRPATLRMGMSLGSQQKAVRLSYKLSLILHPDLHFNHHPPKGCSPTAFLGC